MKFPNTFFIFLAMTAFMPNAMMSEKSVSAMKEPFSNFNMPEDALHAYEQRLSHQSWELIEDLIHEDAVFIFTESTFRGKEEIRQAFEKTFDLIKEEKYWITDLNWVAKTDAMASCEYTFNWEGIIHGNPSSGGGRGSCVLIRTENGWKIIQEHLGPPAK